MHDIGLTHDGGQVGLPLSEAHELELASRALGLSGEHELEAFLGDVFHAVGTGAGRFARPQHGRELAELLRGTVTHALPGLGGGQALDLPSLPQQAGSLLGLELEGLSPQDQEFEAGRGLVRFLGGAYHHAIGAPRDLAARTVARRAMIGSARRFAPGLLHRYRGGGWGQQRDHHGGWPGPRGYGSQYGAEWNRYPGSWRGDGYGVQPPRWAGGEYYPYDPGVPFVHRRHHRHHWYPAYADPGWGYPSTDAPSPPGYGLDGGGAAPPAAGDPGAAPGVPLGDPTAGGPGGAPGGPIDPVGAGGPPAPGVPGMPTVAPTVPPDPGVAGMPNVAPAVAPGAPAPAPAPAPGTVPAPTEPAQSTELDVGPGGYGWDEPDWAAPRGSSRRGRWERRGEVLIVHGL
jgi:hypothetical protein